MGEPIIDCTVDAVGFEARGHGSEAGEAPATVLNDAMSITRAGGSIGIPGLYVTEDPGGVDEAAQSGALSMDFGLGWARSHAFYTGQCPVCSTTASLMMSILTRRPTIAQAVTPRSSPWTTPRRVQDFDSGTSVKYVLDPHGDSRVQRGSKAFDPTARQP